MRKYTAIQIILTIVYFLIVIASFTFSYFYAVQELNHRQSNALKIEFENTALEVELFYSDFLYAVEDIESYVKTFGTDTVLPYLVSKKSHHEHVASMYFGTVDNIMYNSSGFVPPPEFDLRTRIWYQMATTHGKTIITPIFLNASRDFYITTIAKPVYDGNTLIGVAAIDVYIETIENYINTKSLGDTGFLLFIDQNKHVFAYPKEWQVTDEFLHADDLNFDFDRYASDTVHESVTFNTSKGTLYYSHDLLDAYTLVAFIPFAEYHLLQQQYLNFFIIIFTLVILFGLTFIFFNLRFIFNPLKQLDSNLKEIDVRHGLSYRLPIGQNDPFVETKVILNHVLSTTESYFDENAKTSQLLHLEYQRFKLLIDSTQDFIFQIDLNGILVFASGVGLEKLLLKPEVIIGKKLDDLFADSKEIHASMIENAFNGYHEIYDWEITVNVFRYVFETSVSPIFDKQGRIIGAVSISRDITIAKQKQEEIEFINAHDYLTGLYNRRMFQETFDQLNHASNYPLTLMMLDLNGLKLINDAFGHLNGDQALKLVANILNKHLSKYFVARIGGDEFAAILTKKTADDIEHIKHLIIKDVSACYVENIQLSISIGYEFIFDPAKNFNDALKIAENNMYRQKITESMSIRNNAIKAIHKTLTDKYKEERFHSEKVSQMCYITGVALKLNQDQLKELRLAGMYHDIGKIAIPDAILDKPGPLSNDEYEIMKSHTEIGYNILRAADAYNRLAEYALTHHERWDGQGYPRGLSGKDIPLFSRIISLCDTFDAMTTNRPYRSKLTKDEAVIEIMSQAGKQFDPKLAKLFVTEVLHRPWIDKKEEIE